MIPRTLLVLALLVSAVPASAQSLTTSAPYVVLVAGNVADLWTTHAAFSRGAVEGNGLISGQPIRTIALAKTSFTVAIALAMQQLATHGHPRIAKTLGYLDGGITFGVAAHNARVAR